MRNNNNNEKKKTPEKKIYGAREDEKKKMLVARTLQTKRFASKHIVCRRESFVTHVVGSVPYID